MKKVQKLTLIFFVFFITQTVHSQNKNNNVFLDKQGVIRWKDSKEAVALFGANYCLPSACDYRAAGYVSNDRKKMIDQDMTHFARMGWDGLRISLWGDWENCDKAGNLINNDHLDLMDYLIAKATERGIYILFSPVVTYSSQWPDAMNDTSSATGFSKHFEKSELGTNPLAIKAQVNYWTQILKHVNPCTGKAIKDEPAILFMELINEPWHHSEDIAGSVKYINTLVEAIKATGCQKLLFHNVTQDMLIAPAVKSSKVDGVSFAWYPTGLVSGRNLKENYLIDVDDFTPMHSAELAGMPRIVYEFDEPDSYTPYMYPAMVRAFRGVGAQFAAMFSYDMLATAPYNLGWQTHFLNMVYSPQKAAGAIIAAEAMKQLPLYKNYGKYPENTTFDVFKVSYEDKLSEMITADKFYYANTTTSSPKDVKSLNKIVGYGSSPVVKYDGFGLYFLDKIREGCWRLEVYPDAKIISDPFAQPAPDKVVCRLVHREHSMTVNLPDLGTTFKVLPLNTNNSYTKKTTTGNFVIKPGVYLLTPTEKPLNLPVKFGALLFNEFVCPESEDFPLSIVNISPEQFVAGSEVKISVEIVAPKTPESVDLYFATLKYKNWFRKISMQSKDGYIYEATIPKEGATEGFYIYYVTVTADNQKTTYPATVNKTPDEWSFTSTQFWQATVVNPKAALALFNPDKDLDLLSFSRIGDGWRSGIFDVLPLADNDRTAIRLYFPLEVDSVLKDYTIQVPIKEKIKARGESLKTAQGIALRVRGETQKQDVFLTLIESDGTAWTAPLTIKNEWSEINVPFTALKKGKGVLLPLGYPGQWNYWTNTTNQANNINPEKIERVQVSFRRTAASWLKNPWMDVSTVILN